MLARLARLAVLAFVSFLLAAPVGRADEKEDQQLIKISAQKLEADYLDALKQAHALSAKEPAKAAEVLRDILPRVEVNKAITDARRKFMIENLSERINDYDRAAKRGTSSEDVDKEARKLGRDEERRREEEQDRELKASLDQIRKLKDAGRLTEASALADKLRERYRQAEVQAISRQTSVADQLTEAKRLQELRSRRLGEAFRDVERSAILPRGDIDFGDPKRWRELTARRQKLLNPMTDKEKALIKALNTTVSVTFKEGTSFREAIEYIEQATGQTIIVDKDGLAAAGVTYESQIKLSVRNVSVRTLLRKMLGDLGLTFIIENEAISVMTPQQASSREKMVARAYYIGDLLALTDFRMPVVVNQFQAQQALSNLIELIKSIEPGSWRDNGGEGSIGYDPVRGALVVKQSAMMHFVLSGALR